MTTNILIWLRYVSMLWLLLVRIASSQALFGYRHFPQINQNDTLVNVNFTPGVDTSKAAPLPRDIIALSIEFCYIIDYLGDVDSPNELSYNLLNNLQEILGAPPVIRIGGDTGDVAQYLPRNNQTITNIFEPNNLEAVNVSFNNGLFQVMNQNMPENQTYILTLNFGQNEIQYPLAEVSGAETHLNASKLYAYELGNEPDVYAFKEHRSSSWNAQTYAQEQVDWLKQIKQEINNTSHGFQLGAFAVEPIEMGNFSLVEINKLGVPELVGNVKTESDHTYPYSYCPGTDPFTTHLCRQKG